MKSIQAARIDRYGGAEAVQLQDMTLDPPKAGELLVRVYAAGLNPLDWKLRSGFLRKSKPLHLPVTLGGDFSGVIEAVGPGVKDLSIGDAVYGQASPTSGGSGSFAEMLIAPAGTTSLKPKTVSHAEAAVLPLSGVSALQALTEQLRVAAGRSLLIHGGAGGIGSMAIQIAKDLGAEEAIPTRAPSKS
jgi:NADPH:quinone reductase-like Zn-dependent oxidoreductase